VGYVDGTHRLAPVEAVTVHDETIQLVAYPDSDAAGEAFAHGDIAGYLVVPEDYFDGDYPAFHGERRPGPDLSPLLATGL